HGGRTPDTVCASLSTLDRLAAQGQGTASLNVDGGIRRGSDMLKALALGADAVMIGAPILHALAVGGAVGVLHLLTLLRAEFEVAMALTGCRRVGEITAEVVWRR